MTAPSRTLVYLLAGLAVGPTPACINISGTTTPTQSVQTKAPGASDFSIFRPGDVVPTHPEAKAAAAAGKSPADPPQSPPVVPGGLKPAAAQITSQRANLTTEPIVPPPPGELSPPVAMGGPNPGPFPPLASAPPAAEPPLVAAMRAYIENRPDDAIRQLKALDSAGQDFALSVMPLLVRGAQGNLAAAKADDVAMLVDQFHAVAARLEPKAALRVDKVVFCRKVTGFGRFDPWPEAQPYKPNDLAVLYVEVRNIGSESAAGPHGEGYLSRAAVSLEVRDATGKLVEQTDPADWRRRVPVARFEHADHTRSPLRDYSRTYRISVPSQPGVYTVTVEVRDPAGNRTARSQPAEFRVAGP